MLPHLFTYDRSADLATVELNELNDYLELVESVADFITEYTPEHAWMLRELQRLGVDTRLDDTATTKAGELLCDLRQLRYYLESRVEEITHTTKKDS